MIPKRIQEKIIVLIFRFKSLVIINKIRTALHSPYFVEYESRMTYRIRTPSALRTITELMTSSGMMP